MATIADIAEAVKDELNDGEFSQSFSAERHYQPVFDLADMKDLRVTVAAKGIEIAAAGRSDTQNDYQIDVAVQKKIDTADIAVVDGLMALVEEIADCFRLKRLTRYAGAVWVATENTPIYLPEHFEQMRQFTSVLTLTFRVVA